MPPSSITRRRTTPVQPSARKSALRVGRTPADFKFNVEVFRLVARCPAVDELYASLWKQRPRPELFQDS